MKALSIHLERALITLKHNIWYSLVWAIALGTVIMININAKQSYTFIGVTDSKEVNINTNHAVMIKTINVIPGEYVKKGQLLLELQRPDLSMKINEVSHKLEELKSQYNLNASLNRNLKSISKLKKTNTVSDDSLSIQIRSLKGQLDILNQEKKELFIFSSFEGHIGFINYKAGELVSPFDPILTMHKKNPNLVRGYIHESLSHSILEGTEVIISSKARGMEGQINAKVTSIGNRIVAFPERFLKNPNSKMWGREVIVKIPEGNDFLLGEKVYLDITPEKKPQKSFLGRILADTAEQTPRGYLPLRVSAALKEYTAIEPSGLVYMPESNSFLMVSDDNADNLPLVHTINPDGSVENKTLSIAGIKTIRDMEAMAKDEKGSLYVVSSNSKNKKGKVKASRQYLVKMEKKGSLIKVTQKIKLLKALNKIANDAPNAPWVKLLAEMDEKEKKLKLNIDIEGMAVANNTMYLGLRTPNISKGNKAIIIKIANIDDVFDTDMILPTQVSIWKKLSLPVQRRTDLNEGISGLTILDNNMYLATASNEETQSGRVLKLNMENKEIVELANFADYRPEGIAIDTNNNELVVVFDQNQSEALLMSKVQL